MEEIRIGLTRIGETMLEFADGTSVLISEATFTDFMRYYDITLMNPKVLSGMFIGSMMAFLFCGLTMNAVGRAAAHMVEEVRRQFREIKGILTGESEPDYERCVAISTQGAQREMVFPSLLAIVAPIATGLIFGVSGVVGLLIGGLSAGFVLAIFMRMPEGLGIMPRSMSKRVISEESTVKYIKRRLLEIRWATRSKTRLVRV